MCGIAGIFHTEPRNPDRAQLERMVGALGHRGPDGTGMHLEPGVGLGQKPPVYLKAGQTMRLGITGLGEQRQRTVPARIGDAQ